MSKPLSCDGGVGVGKKGSDSSQTSPEALMLSCPRQTGWEVA